MEIKEEEGAIFDAIATDIPRNKRTNAVTEPPPSSSSSEESAKHAAASIPHNVRLRPARRRKRNTLRINRVTYEELIVPNSPPNRKPVQTAYDFENNRCVACGVTFRYDYDFTAHCKEKHDVTRLFRCSRCPRSYTRRDRLSQHSKASHGVHSDGGDVDYVRGFQKKYNRIVCPRCPGVTRRGITDFEKHAISRHPEEKMMACARCDAKFFRRTSLAKHESDKHGSYARELNCKFCLTIFKRSNQREFHEKRCEIRRMKKPIGAKVIEITELEKPKSRNTCEKCDFRFYKNEAYRRHFRDAHPNDKMFPCKRCDQSFSSKVYFNKHMEINHAMEYPNEEPERYFKGRYYDCEYCHRNFLGIRRLEKHGEREHPGGKMFHCGNCSESYAHKKSLDRHLRENHGDFKKTCAHCAVACYNRTDKLRDHERTCVKKRLPRPGVTPYYCRACGLTLYVKDKATIRRHEKTHDRYEKCRFCDKRFHAFNNYRGLEEHMKLRHPYRANIDALLEMIARQRGMKKEDVESGKLGSDGGEVVATKREEAPKLENKLEID